MSESEFKWVRKKVSKLTDEQLDQLITEANAERRRRRGRPDYERIIQEVVEPIAQQYRIADLERENMQLKAEVQTAHRRGFEDGWKKGYEHGFDVGWDGQAEAIEQYIDPILGNLMAMNTIGGKILGVALSAGEGKLAKGHIKDLTDVLVMFVNRTDDDIERATQVYGERLKTMFSGQFIVQLLKAAKEFNQTGSGRDLRDLAASKNLVLADMTMRWEALKPGPKQTASMVMAERVATYIKAGNDVDPACELAVNSFGQKHKRFSRAEQQAAQRIKGSSDPIALVRRHYYNYRDTIKALPAQSEE